MDDIENISTGNAMKSLQGRVPGVLFNPVELRMVVPQYGYVVLAHWGTTILFI
jgi:hypothetical protein